MARPIRFTTGLVDLSSLESEYISVPIDTDPQDILNDAYSFIQNVIPGWTPSDGHLDVWLLQSVASVASESRDVASEVTRSIFRWYGAYLIGLPPIDATAATSETTWTMIDSGGYTVPGGTQVAITDDYGNVIPFETMDDITVFPGSNVTAVGAVNIIASAPGADGNAIGTAGSNIELLDPLTFVDHIVLEAVTSGGQDAETDDDYLNRLSSTLQMLAPRPILPEDFSVFARNIPGVWRATTLDGYNPTTATYNNPRTVSIAVIDQDGNACSTSVKNAVLADLEARREVNFQIYVIDPTYTTIKVTATIQALSGWDITSVQADIEAALNSYLSPATWGTTQLDQRAWVNNVNIRYLEISTVINNVNGVDYIASLTIGAGAGAMGTADLVMSGVAPLPQPGTMTITVTPG